MPFSRNSVSKNPAESAVCTFSAFGKTTVTLPEKQFCMEKESEPTRNKDFETDENENRTAENPRLVR